MTNSDSIVQPQTQGLPINYTILHVTSNTTQGPNCQRRSDSNLGKLLTITRWIFALSNDTTKGKGRSAETRPTAKTWSIGDCDLLINSTTTERSTIIWSIFYLLCNASLDIGRSLLLHQLFSAPTGLSNLRTGTADMYMFLFLYRYILLLQSKMWWYDDYRWWQDDTTRYSGGREERKKIIMHEIEYEQAWTSA